MEYNQINNNFINKCLKKALDEIDKEFKLKLIDLEKKIVKNIKNKKIEKATTILLEVDSKTLNHLVKKISRKKNNEMYIELLKNYLIQKHNIEDFINIEKINFDFLEYIFDEFGINIFSLKNKRLLTNKYDFLLKTKNTTNFYLNYLLSEDFNKDFKKYNEYNIVLRLLNKNNNSENFNRFLKENKNLDIDNAILKEIKLFNYQNLLENKNILMDSKIPTSILLKLIEEKKQEEMDKEERKNLIEEKINKSRIIHI